MEISYLFFLALSILKENNDSDLCQAIIKYSSPYRQWEIYKSYLDFNETSSFLKIVSNKT